MPKFYTRRFEKEVAKASRSEKIQRQAYEIAKVKARAAQKEMVEEFEAHPVTRELEGGATAANLSGTLGGYGNLFSFIGFLSGSNPTSLIRSYLQKSVRVHRKPRVSKSHKDTIMRFRLDIPRANEIEVLTPSPWEGRSWTRGIERNISGFGSYMFSRHENFKDSRSGKAVQSSKQMRTMAYRPIKYMTSILNSFYKKLK